MYAWSPVLCQASSAPRLHLVHLGTRVLTLGDANGPCSGQTLWGDQSEECATGVAWDWVELREGDGAYVQTAGATVYYSSNSFGGFALAAPLAAPVAANASSFLVPTGTPMQVGDRVIREGDWITLDYALPEAAAQSGLSQYELLTLLGRRFPR